MKKMMNSGKSSSGMGSVEKVANVGNSQDENGGTGNYNTDARKGDVDQKQVPRTGCYDTDRAGR